MTRKVSTLLLLVSVSVATVGVAQAGMEASEVSIRYQSDTERFKGKVNSDESECRSGRKVKVYKRTADGRSLQGKDKTNSKGGYAIEVMHANGRYFAVAKKYEGMNDLVCETGVSDTIRV